MWMGEYDLFCDVQQRVHLPRELRVDKKVVRKINIKRYPENIPKKGLKLYREYTVEGMHWE